MEAPVRWNAGASPVVVRPTGNSTRRAKENEDGFDDVLPEDSGRAGEDRRRARDRGEQGNAEWRKGGSLHGSSARIGRPDVCGRDCPAGFGDRGGSLP